MRELREFREHHAEFEAASVTVAGVSRDSVASHRRWVERLRLPYPLLSDPEGRAARRMGLVHRIGVAGWHIELVRRATVLIDAHGVVDTVWGRVKVRGHAGAVLARARELSPLESPSDTRHEDDRPAESSG